MKLLDFGLAKGDGRFLAIVSESRASQQTLNVGLNWTAGIGR